MNIFEEKEGQKTPIEKLGEFGLIDHLTKEFKIKNKNSITGIGDDAAVIDMGKKYQLVSTDLLVEGVHFDLSYMPLKHLGYKSVSVNISDICAMNGKATQITVGIALSNRFSVEAMEEIYSGIKLACDRYNIDLIGGDTTTSKSGLMISVTILGEVEKDKICYRSGANVNDLVVSTGDLGAAYLGFQILNREKDLFVGKPTVQPDLTGHDYIHQRQLRPDPGEKYLSILEAMKITPTSMIDVSDGLSSEVLHLSKCSNVGITIHENKIPIDHTVMNLASDFRMNPIVCSLICFFFFYDIVTFEI